jgi:hypothetical protein
MGVFLGILWYSWVNAWTGDGVATEFTKVVFIENKSLLSYPQKAQNLNTVATPSPVHAFTQEYHRIPKNTPIIPKITLRGPVNIPERQRNK